MAIRGDKLWYIEHNIVGIPNYRGQLFNLELIARRHVRQDMLKYGAVGSIEYYEEVDDLRFLYMEVVE